MAGGGAGALTFHLEEGFVGVGEESGGWVEEDLLDGIFGGEERLDQLFELGLRFEGWDCGWGVLSEPDEFAFEDWIDA